MIFVAFGGFLGAIARFSISEWIKKQLNRPGFVATFFINWCGSFWFGFLINQTYLKKQQSIKLLLTTGLLGGFTTFSTFSLEAYTLFEQQHLLQAFTYILLSGVGSVSLCFLGLLLARKGGRTA